MKKLGSIWALILLLLFLCCATILLVLGVTTYTNVTRSSKAQENLRWPIQYISERIRQADAIEQVNVRTVQGVDVLVFTEREGQDTYESWIYGYHDKLYEISRRKAGGFSLKEGRVIADIQVVSITSVPPNLIKIKFMNQDHTEYNYILSLRSKLKVVQYGA